MTEVSSSRNPFNRRPDRSEPDTERPDRGRPGRGRGRHQGVRALLPLGVVGVVAAGVALAPDFAAANPALPQISAQALLTKLATSTADAYSGTVNITTNLGLPALPDLNGSGADPMSLLSGTHVIQVAANGPTKQRAALLASESEYDLVHNGQQLWIYDSEQNSVEQGTLPAGEAKGPRKQPSAPAGAVPLTPAQAVQQLIAAITPTTGLSISGTQSVAGRSAYTLTITPKQSESLISRAEIAVDAQNGAPLSVALYSVKAPTTPIFQLGFTSVSFSAPPDSRFEFTAPKGATVSPLSDGMSPMAGEPKTGEGASAAPQVLGQGWLSVLEVHGVSLNDLSQGQDADGLRSKAGPGSDPNSSQNPTGLFNGNIGSYLQELGNAGSTVSGAFGSGKLYSTNFATILITDDGRMFIGAVTPSALEADAAAQGTR